MSYTVMVLNDGETYTDLSGCKIVEVPDDLFDDDIERYLKSGNAKIVTRFSGSGVLPEDW